jgi:hypothetical protein
MRRMILSRLHDFVFIKGRKVAGTSVQMALSTICGPDDIVAPITQRDERMRLEMGARPRNFARPAEEERYIQQILAAPLDKLADVKAPNTRFGAHISLTELISIVPEAADMPMVFVERNPYATLLSRANHLKTFEGYKRGGGMAATPEALKAAAAEVVTPKGFKSVRNIDFYRRRDGSIKGARLRYEHLAEDFEAFVRGLGVAEVPALPMAKPGQMSNRYDPRDFFTRAQLDSINRAFADEFEAFGYETL